MKNAGSTSTPTERAAQLRGFRLFRSVADETVFTLASASRVVRLEEGAYLWEEGQQHGFAGCVLRGLVHVVHRHASGEESIVGLFGPHDVVGLPAAMRPIPYPADVRAVTEGADVLCIPGEAFRAALQSDHALSLGVSQSMVTHAQVLHTKIDILSAGQVPERLARLLRHLADRFGDEQQDGTQRIQVPMSRRTLAKLLGVRSETVIRVMTRWQREGLLATDDDGITICEPKKLAALAEPL